MSLDNQTDVAIKQEQDVSKAGEAVKEESREATTTDSGPVCDLDPTESAETLIKSAREYGRGYKAGLTLNQVENQLIKLARRTQAGTTSLPFVYNAAPLPEHVFSREAGRLREGVPHLQPFQEKATHRLKPIYSIEHSSPFSSHLPDRVTHNATASVEQSKVLLNRLDPDSETVDEDIEALLSPHNVYDTTRATINYADSLLEVLTRGQHTRTDPAELSVEGVEEPQQSIKRAIEESQDQSEDDDDDQDEEHIKDLKETTKLIHQLEGTQRKRLALSSIPVRPTAEEIQLAGRVTGKLTSLIGTKTRPADIVSQEAVRKALGIQFLSTTESESD